MCRFNLRSKHTIELLSFFSPVCMNLDQLLQQSLQVLPDCLIPAELQVAKSLSVKTNFRGSGVFEHLSKHAHCQVVMNTPLLRTHT